MKKFSLMTLMAVLACPAFAVDNPDIGASDSTANCDSGVLHSTTGPTAFQAEWSANTININWYNDSDSNTPISLSNSAAGTCTYDGAITLPTNTLNKTGYTFAGWQVRQAAAQSCFAGVDTSIDGSYYWYYNHSDTMAYNRNDQGVDASSYGVTQPGDWAVQYGYGFVQGISSCNNEDLYANNMDNELIQQLMPLASQAQDSFEFEELAYSKNGPIMRPANTFNTSSTGSGCWCRITSYKPTNNDTCTITNSVWGQSLNSQGFTDATECAAKCAEHCANEVYNNNLFRAALFGLN